MQSDNQLRKYPLLSACGLNCGLCSRYYTDGPSRCSGCGGQDFYEKHPKCGVLSCCLKHSLEYCYLCEEYPCKKYNDTEKKDSFITHQNMLIDFQKVKSKGLEVYQTELEEKVQILQNLMDNYNDGRRKGLYCTAVNLLELQDLRSIMSQLADETQNINDPDIKEKASTAVRLFEEVGGQRNISFKLRK